jgi:anhydro-N-acetylmuramic acid kinase
MIFFVILYIYFEKMNANELRVIGMMSGTSLDGVDLACCYFTYKERWNYILEACETYPYPS